MKKTILGITCLFSITAASSNAAVVATRTYTFDLDSTAALTSSSTDLIQSGSSTLTSYTPFITALNGSYGTSDALIDGTNVQTVLNGNGTPFTITYNLNLTTSPLGYEITQFVSSARSGDYRTRQEFSLAYSLVSAPTTFITITSPNHTTDRGDVFQTNPSTNPGDVQGGGGGTTQVFVNITGLSGVAAFQVIQGVPSGNNPDGAQASSEYDLIGTATVPEPSSALLLISGFASLACFRRRS